MTMQALMPQESLSHYAERMYPSDREFIESLREFEEVARKALMRIGANACSEYEWGEMD